MNEGSIVLIIASLELTCELEIDLHNKAMGQVLLPHVGVDQSLKTIK